MPFRVTGTAFLYLFAMILIRLQRLINCIMHFRANTHTQEFIYVGTVNPVRKKHEYEVVFRINPETGAGKARVAKRLRRSIGTWIWLLAAGCIIFLRFVET